MRVTREQGLASDKRPRGQPEVAEPVEERRL
jgi:hypothetical protein